MGAILREFGPPRRRVFALIALALMGAFLWSGSFVLVGPLYQVLTGRRDKAEATTDSAEGLDAGSSLEALSDRLLASLPKDAFDALAVLLGLCVLLVIVEGLVRFAHHMLVSSVALRVEIAVRERLFSETLTADYDATSSKTVSDRLARCTNDLNEIREGVLAIGFVALREPLKFVGCLLAAFLVNWRLTLLFILGGLLLGGAVGRIGRRLKRAARGALERAAHVYHSLGETFACLAVVFAYDGRQREVERLERRQTALYDARMRSERIRAVVSPLVEALSIAAVVAILLPAAYVALRGTNEIFGIRLAGSAVAIPQLVMLFTFLIALADPLRKLAPLWTTCVRADAAANRIHEVFADSEPRSEPNVIVPSEWSTLSLTGLTYSYAGADGPALDDVSLEFERGEVIAFVGSNGSGKSTLVDILAGLRHPSAGRLGVDGSEYGDLVNESWRRGVGFVPQRALLFDGTIGENVRYGREEATDTELLEVVDRVGLRDWLETLPSGFETEVGPRGDRLSGGQRQRLTIARALVRRPRLLLLDEPTSAADPAAKTTFLQAITTDLSERLTILVTHELPAELRAVTDRVVVLDRGRVVACGTDEQLRETCPLYERLRAA